MEVYIFKIALNLELPKLSTTLELTFKTCHQAYVVPSLISFRHTGRILCALHKFILHMISYVV